MDEAKVEPLVVNVPEEYRDKIRPGDVFTIGPHPYRSPVPQPTERTQLDKYGVRYRWWDRR